MRAFRKDKIALITRRLSKNQKNSLKSQDPPGLKQIYTNGEYSLKVLADFITRKIFSLADSQEDHLMNFEHMIHGIWWKNIYSKKKFVWYK